MSKSTRQAFGEALVQIGEEYSQVVVLDADLSKSTKSDLFAKKFPNRFFEMGITEANMVGTAAGLSFTGKLPFVCSFGCFITSRFDMIRLSVAYSQANVRIIGTHAGVGIGDDGYSQMGLEDIALMRALPTMGVFQPMDAEETFMMIKHLVTTWKGPAYLRLTRQALPHLYSLYPKSDLFIAEKIMPLKQPKHPVVACFATGSTVTEALQASDQLKKNGIEVSVWNVRCLKPFDESTFLEATHNTQCIISVEDHSVVGGLGTCIAECLAKNSSHAPLIKLGIQDIFGESGEAAELYQKFKINSEAICNSIVEFLHKGK